MVVSRCQVTLVYRLGVEAELRLAMVGKWRGGRAVAGLVVVVTVSVSVSVKVTVTVTVVVAEWRRRRCRQSTVRVDIWCQTRTGGPSGPGWPGGPGSMGWQGVPVEPNVAAAPVDKVVRLQVVTGPIDKWVWVR